MTDRSTSGHGAGQPTGTGVGAVAATSGRLLAGRYALGAVVGRGAMSTVRVAEDTLLDRRVAVKRFTRAAVDHDLLQQTAEIRLAATLHHPALTALLDSGVDATDADDPRAYLVLPYVDGGDLRELLLGHGALPAADVCRLAVDLAEALQHMHEAGYLHRDVKPANILVSTPGHGIRRAVLADFGISSPIGRPEAVDRISGTAAYLSPEQAQGHDAGTASDVYALGLVLLEALTGSIAFPGPATESALGRLVRDPDVPPWIPSRVAAILRAMTARLPEQRSTMRSVAERFRGIAEGSSRTR